MPQPPTKQGARIRIATTNNEPELVKTIPITPADAERRWQVVMRLGPDTRSDDPMPELRLGDRLRVCAELEVTTDAPVANHPGLMGVPYDYAPLIEARLLLTTERGAVEPGGMTTVLDRWSDSCSHARHHHIVLFKGSEVTIPQRFPQHGFINLALAASHPKAEANHLLLIGENEDRKDVDQDVSGIRVVRFRPARQDRIKPTRVEELATPAVRVAKEPTRVLSMPLDDLKEGEQLFVHARIVADAAGVGYHARLSARMFLADERDHLEPKGSVEQIASWKGHLSKENGSNCLKDEGPSSRDKLGVLRMKKDARHRLFVNVVATSSAPFSENRTPGDPLTLGPESFLEVTRYGPEHLG